MFYKNLSRALVFGSPPQRLTFVWNRGLLSSVLFALFFVTSACDGSGTKGAAASANLECGEGRAVVDGHCIDDANSCETLGVFEQVTSYALSSETLNARVYVDEAAAVHACSVEQGPSGAVSFYYVQRSAEQFEKRAISASDTNALCMAVIGAPNGEAHVLSRSPAALFHTTDYGETWTKVELKGLSGSEIEGALSVPSARAFLGQTKQGVTVALSLSGTLSTPPSLYVARLGAEGLEVLVNGVTKSDPNATGHAPQVLETDEQGLMILFDRLQVPQVVLGDESLSPLAYTEGLLPRAAVGPDCEISVLYADRNSHLQLVSYDPFAFAPEEDLGVVGPRDFNLEPEPRGWRPGLGHED